MTVSPKMLAKIPVNLSPGTSPGADDRPLHVTALRLHGRAPSPADYALFCALLELRASAGAKDTHALSPIDFLATHNIFWLQQDSQVQPIGASRTVSLQTCDAAGIAFPPLEILRVSAAQRHLRAAEQFIANQRAHSRGILFSSDFIIAPDQRRTKRSLLIHELVAAHCAADTAGTTCSIGFASGETIEFFERVGYRPLEDAEGPLPPIETFAGKGGQETLIALLTPSPYAQECLSRHAQLFA